MMTMTNCPECGSPITSSMNFCRACGTPLNAVQETMPLEPIASPVQVIQEETPEETARLEPIDDAREAHAESAAPTAEMHSAAERAASPVAEAAADNAACPKCGRRIASSSMKFCPGCGTPLDVGSSKLEPLQPFVSSQFNEGAQDDASVAESKTDFLEVLMNFFNKVKEAILNFMGANVDTSSIGQSFNPEHYRLDNTTGSDMQAAFYYFGQAYDPSIPAVASPTFTDPVVRRAEIEGNALKKDVFDDIDFLDDESSYCGDFATQLREDVAPKVDMVADSHYDAVIRLEKNRLKTMVAFGEISQEMAVHIVDGAK